MQILHFSGWFCRGENEKAAMTPPARAIPALSANITRAF